MELELEASGVARKLVNNVIHPPQKENIKNNYFFPYMLPK
jgi:hypothetical protein